jgi:cyclopropane fatty-acyl-phospholipid synthase-like methyltransferase
MSDDIQVPARWWETFFTGPFNRFWETVVPPEAAEAEADFLIRHLRPEPGRRLLDVPCGAGRHALALARRGVPVTGIDLSADAIGRARAAAEAEGLPAEFRHADMRDLPAGAGFAGAACMGNSFSYLDPAGTEAFVGALAAALRPGAGLVIDTGTAAESLLPHFQARRRFDFPGGTYETRNAYDPATGLSRSAATLTLDGETHRGAYAHRVFTVAELVRLMQAHGFGLEGLHGGTDDAPFVLGAPRLLAVFRLG